MDALYDFQYFILIAVLLIVPKVLQRYRIPGGLSALAMGVAAGYFWGVYKSDAVVSLFATLGITTLFLFAGLEVSVTEIKRDFRFLAKHLLAGLVLLLIGGILLRYFFDLSLRASLLLSLGLLTPSTGFILDTLHTYAFDQRETKWIRSKAIAMEILALGVLFFTLQSDSLLNLFLSMTLLIGLVFALPPLFRLFVEKVSPHAPQSEFAFLILMALLAGVLTRELGAYYLVGAFVVGVVARRCEFMAPSFQAESALSSLRLFFSFFIPFYFFKSGHAIDITQLTWKGVLTGVVLLLVFVPIRFSSLIYSLRYFHEERWQKMTQISLSMLPTLVFGLVVADILKTDYGLPKEIFAGLMLYTVVVSAFPSFFIQPAIKGEFKPL